MSDPGQFKNFTTRKFRADLHYRLRLLAANKGMTMEVVFNEVMEKGLDVLEKGMMLAVPGSIEE